MASLPFPQNLAFLIAFWINALLYGLYLMLFMRWVSLSKQNTSIIFKTLCWIGLIFATIDVSLNFYLLLKGFWFSLPIGGPEVFFLDLSNWQTVWREVNYQALVIASDSFMVYRVWILWHHKWVTIIIPCILLLLESVFGLMAAISLDLQEFQRLAHSINIFLSFNTALQLTITFLIAFRLLDPRQTKHLPTSQRARRVHLVRVIIESGLLVTIGLILDLALFAQGILFHWVFNICLPQLYAISTVLIVIRMNNAVKDHLGPNYSSHSHGVASMVTDYPRAQRTGHVPPEPLALNFFESDNKAQAVHQTRDSDKASDDIEMKRFQSPGIVVHVRREVDNEV